MEYRHNILQLLLRKQFGSAWVSMTNKFLFGEEGVVTCIVCTWTMRFIDTLECDVRYVNCREMGYWWTRSKLYYYGRKPENLDFGMDCNAC